MPNNEYSDNEHNAIGISDKSGRYRLQHKFWLDMNKDEEFYLIEEIARLKSERQFKRTIVEALLLVLELRQGKTDTLHKLFPWLWEVNREQ